MVQLIILGPVQDPSDLVQGIYLPVIKIFLRDKWLFVFGFNNTSTLVGHFVSSPIEKEKSDRRDSTGDGREGQGRKRNKNESEGTEEI